LCADPICDGNANNDSEKFDSRNFNRDLPGGRHGGDIEGIIIKKFRLHFVLRTTTIWSTPLCEDNDAKFSYHTYGQSDVYKIGRTL
jgi:hypothetical protein